MKIRKTVTALLMLGIPFTVFVQIYVLHGSGVCQNLKGQSFRNLKELQTLNNNTHGLDVLGSPTKSSKLSSKDSTVDRKIESVGKSEPSPEHEMTRRNIERVTNEFWMFVQSELNKLKQNADKNDVSKMVDGILNNSTGYQSILKNYFYKLESEVDDTGTWRFNESQKLGDLVQRRLNYLQNPEDCKSARKLACSISMRCGYTCVLRRLAECLFEAYRRQRTLVLTSFHWKYSDRGMESLFEPLSKTCNSTMGQPAVPVKNNTDLEKAQVIELPFPYKNYTIRTAIPVTVPDDLADRLMRFHGDPLAWWTGQIIKYITRPNSAMNVYFQTSMEKLGFKNPIVGVHVRRTDKLIRQAKFHSLQEYMKHVEEWFDAYVQRNPDVQRKVYLATDDPKVLSEAREKYPHYVFLGDIVVSEAAGVKSRYSEDSLHGIILDIHLLSLCDYLVCTFSSWVCRHAYELMQPRHGDASQWFKSLDVSYDFNGYQYNQHLWRIIQKHEAKTMDEISLYEGDLIGVPRNHWNGYSKGKNLNTGRSGLFPSYKAVDKVDRVKMPTYPEVPDLG